MTSMCAFVYSRIPAIYTCLTSIVYRRYLENGLSLQSRIAAILSPDGFVVSTGESEGTFGLVLESTSFYAEQGGQVADTGTITSTSGSTFEVEDTQAN